ncbi:MAG: M15 family metallopeptidase [Pseudoxanthomonas sp.]
MRNAAALILSALACAACSSSPDSTAPVVSRATTFAQAGLVDMRSLVPDIAEDIRYAGSDNFVGAPIDGYRTAGCFLRESPAKALQEVERVLRAEGFRLQLFDCYRPARAVAHFVRWAGDLQDQRTRARHYPNLGKQALLGEYIAPVSGHSRGATVDLTLLDCRAGEGKCHAMDMGTDFDFFDPRANTDSPAITPQQRDNRQRLLAAMAGQGFRNYPQEWWHFSLVSEQSQAIYDIPVE